MTLYLLHSTVRIGGPRGKGASHYLGWAEPSRLEERLRLHRTGRSGVAIVRAFLAAGAELILVKTWSPGDRQEERKLKNQGHLRKWCPLCATPKQRPLPLPLPPRHHQKPKRSASGKPPKVSGTASPSGSPTGASGWFQAELPPASGTPWDAASAPSVPTPGGTATPAPVRPPRRASTSPAGTRLPASSTSRFLRTPPAAVRLEAPW